MACIDKLKAASQELHDYLREKAGVDYNENTGEGKDAWIKAAKELQEHSLKTLNDVYVDAGVKGFEKSKIQAAEKPLIDQAKDLVNSDVVKGFSADVLKDAANNNPEDFNNYLSEIAQQAHDSNSNKATVETYGKPLVDIAQKLFPEESEKSLVPQNDNTPLTKEAKELLDGLNSGSKPTFITKNLEKIANENGIEITDKMSADDVINALKEKNNPQTKNTENEKNNTTDGRTTSETNQSSTDSSQKPAKEKGIFERAKAITSTDPYDRVLQYFSDGGKINNSVVESLFGNSRKSTEGQRKSMIGFLKKDGKTIDQLAHSLWESDANENHTTQDYKEAIEAALNEHGSPAEMAKELVSRNDPDEAYKKFITDRFGEDLGSKEDVIDAVNTVEGMSMEEINHLLELEGDATKEKELDDYINSLNQKGSSEQNLSVDEGGAPPIITPVDIEAVKNNNPTTGITHEQTNEIARQLGFGEYEANPETVAEWDAEAYKRIKEDPQTLPRLIDKMQKGGQPDKVEQRIMAKYVATLKAEIEKNPTNEKIAQIRKVIDLSNMAGGREVGKSLVARKGAFDINDSLAGYFMTEMDANLNAPLTKSQNETVQKEYADISSKDAIYKEKIAALEAENARLKAEGEVKKSAGKKSTGVKKTHEDFVKERKATIESIREKLKDARTGKSGLTAVPVPYAKELAAITPDVLKLVKSYVEEGVTKLSDIVKNIHPIIKESLADVKEKDIHDIIAGEYNKKQKTKSQVAETLFNLRKEAELINKLEKLQNGEEPKSEKKKIKRNQEIESLQSQIKDYKKEEGEANKFYGESDASEKRIQAKEDELKRLKERKDKEPKESEKKEISEREQKLNDEIKSERDKIRKENAEANKFYGEEKNPQKAALQSIRKRNEKSLKDVEEELKTGDFAEKEKKIPLIYDTELKKKFPQLYADALKSQNDLIKAKEERQLRLAVQEYNNRSKYQKFKDQSVRLLNVPRTLMASMDYSAPLRQAVVVTVAHPIMAAKAGIEMFKTSVSQSRFDNWTNALKESDRYPLMIDSGLSLTDPHSLHLMAQEEAFMGNIAEKIPVIGGAIKGSERAYVTYLNKMRADLFNRYADLFEDNGRTFANSPELYKGIASYVNNATGRGHLGFAEAAAPVLNSFLFSPRLIASRINMLGLGDIASLGQGFYGKLPPEIRRQAGADMAKFIIAGIGVLALAHYGFGAKTETDPRSSDFGKITVGDTRWDIWGGFQPYVRVIAQVATAQRKTATHDKIVPLEGKGSKFGTNRGDPLLSFGRGKLAPIPSMVWDALSRRTVQGNKILFQWGGKHKDNEITLKDEAIQHFLPLIYSDVSQAMKDGGIKSLLTVGVPSTFGVGVQTYTKK